MNEILTIKQATIADVEELAVLFDQYRMFYGQPSDVDRAKAFLFERFEHRESVIFTAGAEDRLVGFTQLYPSFSSISLKRSWILNDLYVSEDYRGQGAAQLLIDEARRFATLTRAKGIELSTAPDNKRAQRLYERNGFVRDEEFYHYYLTL